MQKLLTDGQLCEVLGVTRPFLLTCRSNGMPYYRMGERLLRYNLSEVLEWMTEHKSDSVAS